LALARRTRDLRLAVLLARASARVAGIAGYAAGLALIVGLLERQWSSVHPALDASDGNDPTMRLNALAPLVDSATGLADLRDALVGRPGSAFTVRLIELAWGKTDLRPNEARPTQTGVLEGLRAAAQDDGAVLQALRSLQPATHKIEAILGQQVGVAGPDLRPLKSLAACCAQAVAQLEGAPAPAATADGPSESQSVGTAGFTGDVQTRGDVLRTLELACDWIERNEPTNPAPLLIRRAQKLMSKSFMELVRDLAPDGLPQIERIAGVGGNS
jgi:type VI secretion system protein ImpA